MYILKDQSLVLTSTWIEDITVTLDFQHCKTKLNERFSQQISLSQQPFDQALVIKNKQARIKQEFRRNSKLYIPVYLTSTINRARVAEPSSKL